MSPSHHKQPSEARVKTIFQRLSVKYQDANTELNYINAYTLLVAVVLSAQATDVSVNKATAALFALADTPQKMVKLGEEKLKTHIKTIGLFNTKAKNVIALSQRLIADFGGNVPSTREELITLPGVGRKTANVVLNEAFDHATIAVDTHVARVAERLDLAHGNTPDAIEEGLEKIIPKEFKKAAHIQLILHGRYVCKARKPLCAECILNDLCTSPDKKI